MSDVDLAIKNSKKLESLLESKLGATGRGLHEKVSSVEPKLPRDLVRKIRLVATVRNKIVHESDYQRIDNRREFLAASKEAQRALKSLGGGKGSGKRVLMAIAVLLLIVAAVVIWKIASRR